MIFLIVPIDKIVALCLWLYLISDDDNWSVLEPVIWQYTCLQYAGPFANRFGLVSAGHVDPYSSDGVRSLVHGYPDTIN